MIYVIFGKPGEGKSLWMTLLAVNLLKSYDKQGNSAARKVFSNYPIVYTYPLPLLKQFHNIYLFITNIFKKKKRDLHKGRIIRSYIWRPDYVKSGLFNADIFIDEAYRYFSSRNFKSFDVNTHDTFATNRHSSCNYFLAAQHFDRLDLIIREIVTIFYHVKKYSIPLLNIPLLFKIKGYEVEKDYDDSRKRGASDLSVSLEFMIPDRRVMNSYNTRFFKKNNCDEEIYDLWPVQ